MVSWNGTDDAAGIANYTIYKAEDEFAFGVWIENTTNTSSMFTGGMEGSRYSFYSTGTDRCDNIELPRYTGDTSTTIDLSPPVSGITSLARGNSPGEIVARWSGNDSISGIRWYDIYVSDDGGPFFLWQCATIEACATFVGENGHEYSFYSIASDNAGNCEAAPDDSGIVRTRVDINAPVTTLAVGEPNFGREPIFIAPSTELALNGTDDLSGVRGTWYSIDGGGGRPYNGPIKITTSGPHELAFWSTDFSGNNETPKEFDFLVDGDAPATAVRFEGPYCISGTKAYITVKTAISLEAADNASGVARIEYNLDNKGYVTYSKPIGFDSAGTHTLVFRSVDNVGNVEGANTVTAIVDSQAPVTKVVAGDLISNKDITIQFNANDTESGVSATYFRVVRERTAAGEYKAGAEVVIQAEENHSADGNYTIQYYSVDRLNNTEIAKELKVTIDTQVFLQLGFSGTPKVNADRFTIDGRTERGAILTVDGEKVAVASDGSFSYEMGLEPGRNEATIVVVDSAGNSMTRPVHIDYDKPVAGVGWLWMVLVGLVVVGGVAGGGLLYLWRRKGKAEAVKAAKGKRPIKKARKSVKRQCGPRGLTRDRV